MAELKNVKTKYISLLHDEFTPTNDEELIIKSKDGISKNTIEVIKADEIKGLITCIVMKANYVDSQGDWYSNETVDEAQAWHMNNIINEGKNEPSDTNHNFEIAKGVKLKESYVDKSTDNYKWIAVLDSSENLEVLQKAKEGKLTGVSIAGQAEKIDKGIIETIKALFKEHFKPKENINKGNDMTKEEIQALNDEQLAELNLMKIPAKVEPEVEKEVEKAEETQEAPEKETPAEPDKFAEMQKAFDTKLEEMQTKFDKDLLEVAKGRMTGTDNPVIIKSVNEMTELELKNLRESDPEGYKKMLKEQAKK